MDSKEEAIVQLSPPCSVVLARLYFAFHVDGVFILSIQALSVVSSVFQGNYGRNKQERENVNNRYYCHI